MSIMPRKCLSSPQRGSPQEAPNSGKWPKMAQNGPKRQRASSTSYVISDPRAFFRVTPPHLTPTPEPSWAVPRTGPRGGARCLPVPRGAHPCGARPRGHGPVGPAGLGWGLGGPSRGPCSGGWAQGRPRRLRQGSQARFAPQWRRPLRRQGGVLGGHTGGVKLF